jgi:MSHA pilin protein MshD
MTLARQRGLTMVELIIFIVIVGIAVVGVLQVISVNTAKSADPIRRKQAMAIAESLMDEIRSAGFSYCDPTDPAYLSATSAADCTVPEGPGPEPAGGQRPFDNVNDYGAFGVPAVYNTDVAGNAFPAGYTATVTIAQAANLGPAGSQVPAAAALAIVVRVNYGNDAVTLESYRTRYAPNF